MTSDSEAKYVETGSKAPSRDSSERLTSEVVFGHIDRLVEQHVALALADLSRRSNDLKSELTTAILGGLIIYASFLAAMIASVLLLSLWLASWLAVALVAIVTSLIGYSVLTPRDGERSLSAQTLAEATQNAKCTAGMLKEARK